MEEKVPTEVDLRIEVDSLLEQLAILSATSATSQITLGVACQIYVSAMKELRPNWPISWEGPEFPEMKKELERPS